MLQPQQVAACCIQKYWRLRFKHVTLKSMRGIVEKFKLTIPDTARMSTTELKQLISTVRPVNAFIALLSRLMARCARFEELADPRECLINNPWIFIRAFLFYHSRVHTKSANLKRICKDVVDVSRKFLDNFFRVLDAIYHLDHRAARGLSASVREFIRVFYLWNDELTREHRKQETEMLTRDVVSMAEFSDFKKHAVVVYAIHSQLNGSSPIEPLRITQEECIRQLVDIMPLPTTGYIAAAKKWGTFRRAIKDTHILIHRIQHQIDTEVNVYTAAAISKDALETWLTTRGALGSIMDDFLALAVMEHRKFEYKVQEFTLRPRAGRPLTFVDLGKHFKPFEECRMIWHFEHGHHSMAIIENDLGLAPYMVFARGSNACTVLIVPVDKRTVCITAESSGHGDPIAIAIVELKLCAACGKPAQRKCAACWTSWKYCVRYCSKECQMGDVVYHRSICGRRGL
jgi:hypothetical protein